MKKLLKALLYIIGTLFVLLFIGPVLSSGEINIGIITGLGIAAIAFSYAIFFDIINKFFSKILSKTTGKIIVSLVLAILLTGIGTGGFILANVVKHSSKSDAETEYIIVLGCKVNGTEPGRYLKGRINTAYKYLNENPEAKAILSGGMGNGESISEAQCMFNSLTEMGIAPDRLMLEDKSTSTYENMKNSKQVLESHGISINELTVITNDFHEYRAISFAKRCGFKAVSCPYKTPWVGYLPFAFREVYAIGWQLILH